MVKMLMFQTSKRRLLLWASPPPPRHSRTLPLEVSEMNGWKQMKTCPKCCVSGISWPMSYAISFLPDYVPIPFLKNLLRYLKQQKTLSEAVEMVKNVMFQTSRYRQLMGGFAPRPLRTLPLVIIRNGRKQMKTCAKCCVSRIEMLMSYAISFGRTTTLFHSLRPCLGICQKQTKTSVKWWKVDV